MEKTKEQKFDELQTAFQRLQSLINSINSEMSEKAKAGILWENGKCKDWQAYEIAQHNFNALQIKYLS